MFRIIVLGLNSQSFHLRDINSHTVGSLFSVEFRLSNCIISFELWQQMKEDFIVSSLIKQWINRNMGTFPVHLPSSAAFCSAKVAHEFFNWSFCLFISPTMNATSLCRSPISSFCQSMGWSFNQAVLWSTPRFLGHGFVLMWFTQLYVVKCQITSED